MIESNQQYIVTMKQAKKFKQAIQELEEMPDDVMHPIQRETHLNALHSQLGELQAEMDEWASKQLNALTTCQHCGQPKYHSRLYGYLCHNPEHNG